MLTDVMTTPDTRRLVIDYIQHQLRKKGLPWPCRDTPDESAEPSKVEQTMRLIGAEFEQRYTQVGFSYEQFKIRDVNPGFSRTGSQICHAPYLRYGSSGTNNFVTGDLLLYKFIYFIYVF